MKLLKKLTFVLAVALSVYLISGVNVSQANSSQKPVCGMQFFDCPPGMTGQIIKCNMLGAGPQCYCTDMILSNCRPE